MLALREYAVPIISGVSVTIVVFIPMMFLPGIMGKFLAYIPITIFGVLASGLVLALTVNSALYLLFVRKSNTYVESDTTLEYATPDEHELLSLEREGKTKLASSEASLRTRLIHSSIEWYKRVPADSGYGTEAPDLDMDATTLEEECPHCWAANLAVQRRRELRVQLGNVKRVMTRSAS